MTSQKIAYGVINTVRYLLVNTYINLADQVMYEAKKAGKLQYMFSG